MIFVPAKRPHTPVVWAFTAAIDQALSTHAALQKVALDMNGNERVLTMSSGTLGTIAEYNLHWWHNYAGGEAKDGELQSHLQSC